MGQTVTSEGDHGRIEVASPCYIKVSFIIPKHNSDLRRKMGRISHMEWKHTKSSSEVNLSPQKQTQSVAEVLWKLTHIQCPDMSDPGSEELEIFKQPNSII